MSIDRMKKGWNTTVYAFYDPNPATEYNSNGRKCHVFRCTGRGCTQLIKRYLDTSDAQSTGNMRRHVKKCWGEDVLSAAESTKDPKERTKVIRDYRLSGSIAAAFERKGKGKVTYSHQTHTRTETRYHLRLTHPVKLIVENFKAEIVHWVSESNRPFAIVKDRGFQSLMKTGRPNHYIPHPTTVSCDVKKVFARARRRIAKMLWVCSDLFE
jgi:hypothetical protein